MGTGKQNTQPYYTHNVWTQQIPNDQWSVYQSVIGAARVRGLRFALGGAFAVATYTGRWRNTKDLDIYVEPEGREAMIEVLTLSGLQDYYEKLPYNRNWIYRAYRDEIIVDIIWAMANKPTQVDEIWLARGPQIEVRGVDLRIVPPEELIWAKLYVLQKDRCDWPDILNLVYILGETLKWGHLLDRLDQDAPLLSALLSVFAWLSPQRAWELPEWLWERLHLQQPQLVSFPEETLRQRVSLLDSRSWFVPVIPPDQEPF